MKIAVTGATGYIGARFVAMASAAGHHVVALSRRRPASVECYWIPYELSAHDAPLLPGDTAVVLHLAASTSPCEELDSSREIAAARLLINAAERVGAKFVFVSSQTACPDAVTPYGQIKWHIEQLVTEAGGLVVRPGQVYGGRPAGLFGKLLGLVRRFPVLPAFIPPPLVQPIHIDDLASGLLKAATTIEAGSAVLCLASPAPLSFTEFLRQMAQYRLRLRRLFVPVPTGLILVGARVLNGINGIRQLRSLLELPVMETRDSLQLLDLQLRPLASGMNRSGDDCRRRLLIEGRTFLCYLLRVAPDQALLRRYVRAIRTLRGGGALDMPVIFVRFPALLALADAGTSPETAWQKEFLWRLDAATVLAEATTEGARRFLGLGTAHGFIGSIADISRAVASETVWRVVGLLAAPLIRRVLPRSIGGQP